MSLKLEVGNYYLNAKGEIILILFKNEDDFEDASGNIYTESGELLDNRKYDIIAEIPKELHWKLMYNIKNFHTNGNVRKKLKRKYHNYINCCVDKDKEIKK